METLLFVTVLFLAYANGANDNIKGVATLYGSGTLGFWTAIILGTAAAFIGSLLVINVSHGLIAGFSSAGLVSANISSNGVFPISVGLGAAATVMLATRFGLPVSTTHGLLGKLTGAGIMASKAALDFSHLGAAFIALLLLSPLAAFMLVAAAYPLIRWLEKRGSVDRESCVCIGVRKFAPHSVLPVGEVAARDLTGAAGNVAGAMISVGFGSAADYRNLYIDRYFGIATQKLKDALHVLSALAVSLARGLNDAPKIVALLILSSAAGRSRLWTYRSTQSPAYIRTLLHG